MYENYLEIISKTTLFSGIDESGIKQMLSCLKPAVCSYKKNDFIAIEGDSSESIGIILSGESTVSKENAAGNRIVMVMLKQGDIFGEMVAFSMQPTWPATVQAQQACEVLLLGRDKIVGECQNLCGWHRKLIRNFLKIISQKAIMLNKKVEYLTIKSMRGKISTYLFEQYKKIGERNVNLSLSRSELADFLNVSRPSMSREMCKMRDEGIIEFYLSAIKILDLEALKLGTLV